MNITWSSFVFEQISPFKRKIQHPSEDLVINLTPNDSVYSILTGTNEFNIYHQIPFINNCAPSLDQWYNNLIIYSNCFEIQHENTTDTADDNADVGFDQIDLNCSSHNESNNDTPKNNIQTQSSDDVIISCIKKSFWKSVNFNFIAPSKHKPSKRDPKIKPLYFCYYDTLQQSMVEMPIKIARMLYGKLYEKMIFDDYDLLSLLDVIHISSEVITKNNQHIYVRGYNCKNSSRHVINNFAEALNANVFGCEYCLAEILTHYDNMDECYWNKHYSDIKKFATDADRLFK